MHVLRSARVQTLLAFAFGLAFTGVVLSSAAHGAALHAQHAVYFEPGASPPAITSPALQLVAAPLPLSLQAAIVLLDAGPLAPTLPDPLDEPLGFWDALKDLRRTGGFWAAIAIALATLMAAFHKRAVPRPGEEPPPPTSWRARSIALLAGLGAVLGAGADMLLGLGNWAAFFTVIVASASLIWRAINPPKSGKPEEV
ncbi:MAG: hypothetical protein ACRCU1_02590 [Alsobacter sp.]